MGFFSDSETRVLNIMVYIIQTIIPKYLLS